MINLLHLGDITKIKGANVPLVDIVTGGSPCQDLSCAGKRAGLAGERSGLFMDQIRIIKEMRENGRRDSGRTDEFIRPRYMVWENVPGAFSSNKGEDFRAVLEETARVADKDAVIPRPPKGKWTPSGAIMGDGWSIAWRVHDAQFWGLAQRRKRIALVADFGGLTAPEILFERKGMSGDIETCGEPGKDAAADAGIGTTEAGKCLNGWDIQSKHIQPEDGRAESLYTNSGIYEADTSRTLDLNGGNPGCNQGGMAVVEPILLESNQNHATIQRDGVSTSLPASMGMGGGYVPMICLEGNGQRDSHKGDGYKESETMYTLNTVEQHAVCIENHPADSRVKIAEDGVCQTLSSRMGTGGGNVPMVMEGINGEISGTLDASYYKGCGERQGVERIDEEKVGAQTAKGPGAVCQSVVRRLTPLECERLQGYPDGWTDIGDWVDSRGKTHKGDADSPRYKALGNSIALPFWQWMAKRMVSNLGEHPNMASLFDGIGGFPLVFSRCGCEPVWASEIEEFPIAVTKKRFPEQKED